MFAWMALCVPAFAGLGVCALFGRRFERWQAAVLGYGLLNLAANLPTMGLVLLLKKAETVISAASFALGFTLKYTAAACLFAGLAALLFEAAAARVRFGLSFEQENGDGAHETEKN